MISNITKEIVEKSNFIDNKDLPQFQQIIAEVLGTYEIKKRETTVAIYDEEHQKAYTMFFIAKKIEGLSKRTLKYYKSEVDSFLIFIQKRIENITTDDIRYYLAIKQSRDNIGEVTANNIRRCLSSFFSWVHSEGYISKNPVFPIKSIKAKKQIKHAFTDIEIEKIKEFCLKIKNPIEKKRNIAIIETFLSTGCRVGEITTIKVKDINFEKNSILVTGKGSKERTVFLNAKSVMRIKEYLTERKEKGIENEYLFVSLQKPYRKLEISGIEIIIRQIGNSLGIKCHPHKFRRTAATMALNRGMSLINIQRMLGHESVETTRIYLDLSDDALELQHRKFM